MAKKIKRFFVFLFFSLFFSLLGEKVYKSVKKDGNAEMVRDAILASKKMLFGGKTAVAARRCVRDCPPYDPYC